MTVGLLYNKNKKESVHYVRLLKEAILEIGTRESGDGERWNVIDSADDTQDFLASSADLLISIGGDGTFLKTAAIAIRRDLPVLGFHLGTLGLLTEFDKNDLEKTVLRLVKGDYIIEERMTLNVQAQDREGKVLFEKTAINDCVLSRGTLSKVAYLNLYINQAFVDTYPCDGIIVSTQTGSTAYSLSAGGPIVEPGNDVIVITPICAHYTDGRSIIARSTSNIEMDLCRPHHQMFLTADGYADFQLPANAKVICTRDSRKVRIIRIDPPNFYEALRKKASERRERIHHEE
ncbi:MAG: NAD(+)/NADH kinase [Clostridia bacterium]